MEHRLEVKVYLEDTDAQGIVYHANYLKYCERARTELLAHSGHRLSDMQRAGWTFVVHEMHLRFKKAARLHDVLEVATRAERASKFRIEFAQSVGRVGESGPLVLAEVQVVAIGEDGGLRELPNGLFAG